VSAQLEFPPGYRVKQINGRRSTHWKVTCERHDPPATVEFHSRSTAMTHMELHNEEHANGVYDDDTAPSEVL